MPGLVVRLFGMRRSGNHAIADWLLRNAPDAGSLFLNNCSAKSPPLDGFRSLVVNGRRRNPGNSAQTLAALRGQLADGALVLISYEDHAPLAIDRGGDVKEVLVYRSFRNWVASLLVKIRANPAITPSRRASTILRAFDTYADLLRLIEANGNGAIAICYDTWVGEMPYRAKCLESLGLTLQDNDIGTVQPYGGGSSFQKGATDATRLQSTTRWQQLAADSDYVNLMRIAARDRGLMQRIKTFFPDEVPWLMEFID